MKILYISKNRRTPQFPFLIDYQDDSLLYGLKEHFGDDVVDCNRRHNLYWDYTDYEVATEYGRGFTCTRLLDSDNADRTDIAQKIKNKFFDLVVYGNVWRANDYSNLVLENYEAHQIAYIDGEDNPRIHPAITQKGVYFKRELIPEQIPEAKTYFDKIKPISFAFPTKKATLNTVKQKRMALSDPRNPQTYVFNNERDYYKDYQISRYAITMKKAGWDAMRHYEILGNGCVPMFLNLLQCPKHVMTRFPKSILVKAALAEYEWLEDNYAQIQAELADHFLKHNTTRALAQHFLDDLLAFKPA